MRLRYQLARPDGTRIHAVQGTVLEAAGVRGRCRFDPANPRIAGVFGDLDRQDVSEVELYALAAVEGGRPLQHTLHECLSALKRVHALSYIVRLGRQTVARILPLGERPIWDRDAGDPLEPLSLCADAYFRISRQGLHLHAPRTSAEVIVEPPFINGLMELVCDTRASEPPSHPALRLLRHVLADTGHLTADTSAAGWSFADSVFHGASRMGHEWGPFGRHSGGPLSAPAQQPPRVVSTIDLRGPLRTLPRTDPSFTTVLEGRRSRRYPGAQPLALAELAGVLALAAEPTMVNDPVARWRYPYPSGGGLYGYRVYVAIHRCLHLEPGLYRHASEERLLQKLDAPVCQTERLTEHCSSALGLNGSEPDAVLILTAEIGEFTARYDAIAYRLVLLGAGCLIQNLSLAASALKLGGCAVGGGNPVLFAEIGGADPLREPSIAEFALSGQAP